MLADGQRTNWCRNIAENFNRLSRAHERYRQTTDDRRTDDDIIANVNVSLRSLKIGGRILTKLQSVLKKWRVFYETQQNETNLNISVSGGCAATYFGCGGKCYNSFV